MNIKNCFYVALFSLILSLAIQGQQPNWYIKLKQIKPLESSKAEVEELFINAKVDKIFVDKGQEFVFYKNPEGELAVRYSIGNCVDVSNALFNVEKGKVIRAIFFPAVKTTKLSKFKIKKSDFSREREDDFPIFHYINKVLGINYGIYRENVIEVLLFPSSKSDNLKCENLNKK